MYMYRKSTSYSSIFSSFSWYACYVLQSQSHRERARVGTRSINKDTPLCHWLVDLFKTNDDQWILFSLRPHPPANNPPSFSPFLFSYFSFSIFFFDLILVSLSFLLLFLLFLFFPFFSLFSNFFLPFYLISPPPPPLPLFLRFLLLSLIFSFILFFFHNPPSYPPFLLSFSIFLRSLLLSYFLSCSFFLLFSPFFL